MTALLSLLVFLLAALAAWDFVRIGKMSKELKVRDDELVELRQYQYANELQKKNYADAMKKLKETVEDTKAEAKEQLWKSQQEAKSKLDECLIDNGNLQRKIVSLESELAVLKKQGPGTR